MAHDQKIFIFFQFLHQAVIIGAKYLVILRSISAISKRASDIFNAFQCFLIIIQISKCNYKLVILILLNVLLKLCLIIEDTLRSD